MIQTEFYITRKDGMNLWRTYSDKDVMIQKVGTNELYGEAIDIEGNDFIYTETEIPISVEMQVKELEEQAEAYDIIIGKNE